MLLRLVYSLHEGIFFNFLFWIGLLFFSGFVWFLLGFRLIVFSNVMLVSLFVRLIVSLWEIFLVANLYL